MLDRLLDRPDLVRGVGRCPAVHDDAAAIPAANAWRASSTGETSIPSPASRSAASTTAA